MDNIISFQHVVVVVVVVYQLAKRGLNVVLMSRSEEKLNEVATEISKLSFPVG